MPVFGVGRAGVWGALVVGYNLVMEPRGIVTMILVLGGLWGGFAYFLYHTLSQDK